MKVKVRALCLFALVAMILAATLLWRAPIATQAARATVRVTPTQVKDWSQLVDIGVIPAILSNSGGSVDLGGCSEYGIPSKLRSLAQDGTVKWNNPSSPTCFGSFSAVDKTGAVYMATPDLPQQITKYVKGKMVWSMPLPSAKVIVALQVGANGNIYAVTGSTMNSDGLLRLLGLTPDPPLGTILPKVVLDKGLDVPEITFAGFASYYNGLILRYSIPSAIQYFGFDGSSPGLVNLSNIGYEDDFSANVGGEIFLPVVANSAKQLCMPDKSGLPADSTLMAYGPNGHRWTYRLPACTTVYTVRPTPDGGVVVRANRHEIVGNRLLQGQYLFSLRGDGTNRWPNPVMLSRPGDPLSYSFQAIQVTLAGDVAIVENYLDPELGSGVVVYLDSGIDSSRIYTKNFVPSQNGGNYSYIGGWTLGFATASNMAYVMLIHCPYGYTPPYGATELHGLNIPGMGMDYPRSQILKGTQVVRKLVAIGDSFSSGEGDPPFLTGTDTSKDKCHRSTDAYSELLANDPTLHLSLTKFVACSGATTTQMTSVNNGEPSQLDALRGADVVTLTAGGNDIGFREYATACVPLTLEGGCDATTPIYRTTMSNIKNKLPAALKTLYQAIKTKIGNKTKVLVIGYPMLLSGDSVFVGDCNFLTTESKVAAMNVIANLNLEIMYAVKAAGSQFMFVSAAKPDSPFAGHPECSQDSYFNGVNPKVQVYSFHPNGLGQYAYYQIVSKYI